METTAQPLQTRQIAEKISYDEFLKKYTDVHAEWIEGEVIQLMTAFVG